jgi:hypothetical protein
VTVVRDPGEAGLGSRPAEPRAAVTAADPSLAHLLGRLAALEEVIRATVGRRRADDPEPEDRFRGLYLSPEKVARLVDPAPTDGQGPPDLGTAEEIRARVEADADRAEAAGATLRLRWVERSFDLTPLDVELLLAALAADIDPRLERLYSYLHDDVARRRASIGLALELAGSHPLSAAARARLLPGAPLLDGGLVTVVDEDRPFLTRSLRVPDRVVQHLLGDDRPDPLLVPMIAPPAPCLGGDPVALAEALRGGIGLCYIQEQRGASGRALGAAAYAELGISALVLDLTRLAAAEPAAVAQAARREARLTGAGFVVGPVEELATRGPEAVDAFCDGRWGAVLAGQGSWDPAWSRTTPLLVEAQAAAPELAAKLWQALLDGETEEGLDVPEATTTLKLAAEQIERAVSSSLAQAAYAGTRVGAEELREGARSQNASGLERLAHRIRPSVGWNDIVLPPRPLLFLEELSARVRLRPQVLDEWGMREGGGKGEGIAALFAGPPGTGKTMAAEVIANDLGFDLYTIDLATVVDKYIGETEKNLDRIFGEAERVNGVLFFDEADALFGKRSEVKDAHDRYANVETAFLLQRMESFDGIAILATNLRSNLDEAFARRLDALVDFPLPDLEHRRLLWQRTLRAGVPRDDNVDLEFLAQAFELSGGHIRNIALAAAFMAAAEDRPVSMADLIRGTQREFLKLGRLCLENEFGRYFAMLT